jgi:tRNA U34 2-thiouridine synthase MnmA/TrmU
MRALCVFSGGLDSMLAAAVVRNQGIAVLALFFETPFFSSKNAVLSARSMDLPIKIVEITDRHLKVVKNPRYGYGGNMNPCIDCHTLMFQIAGERLEQEKADFIITGEVLGQRPMSQNRQALDLIATRSGIGRRLLRPLSAKHLPITLPEEKGWINREGLLDFQGRSRKPQMALAKKMDIEKYPAPAGGCLLTDQVFSRRLRDLLSADGDPPIRHIELLKYGRHFRLDPKTKVVVGRNKGENKSIASLAGGTDRLLTCASVPGPTVLLQGEATDESIALAGTMAVSYSDKKEGIATEVIIRGMEGEARITAQGVEKSKLTEYGI